MNGGLDEACNIEGLVWDTFQRLNLIGFTYTLD